MRLLGYFIILAVLSLVGCGGDGGGTTSNPPAPVVKPLDVTLQFAAQAGDSQPITGCRELQGLGITGVAAQIADFAFYVHDIELIDNAGKRYPVNLEQNRWQYQNVALLDFIDRGDFCKATEPKPTNTQVVGRIPEVPEGTRMVGIAFKVGVPSDLNHIDASKAPSPLNRPGLFWNWQTGFKYMRLDVEPVGGITRPDPQNPGQTQKATRWNLHLGATGCEGDPVKGEKVTCKNPNIISITLNGTNPLTQKIVLDYLKVVLESNLTEDKGGPVGCMSGLNDPECAAVFKKLNLPWGSQPAPNFQEVFFLR